MTTILLALALAADITPAQLKQDAPDPKRYLYGVARIEGKVKMRLIIDDTGKVRSVKVLQGRPELVAPAVRMVHDYRYAPAQLEGRPVASDLEVELNFRRPTE